MKTILIVDDNTSNLAARRLLQDTYRVVPVTKGQQALTYLESGTCDLILLDLNIPDMDGFELMDRIHGTERCRSLPVVCLTANSNAEIETRCFRKGALDFIAKPFVPEVMLSRIGRILELEDLRRSLADKLAEKTREAFDMRNKSRQDSLTGLWNKSYTEETVNDMLKRGISGALIMLDIDNFKPINDNHGHIAGDRTLKTLAEILRSCSARHDVLCRIGGDEFAIFVKDVTSKAKLTEYATDISLSLHRKMSEFGFQTGTTVSIGIALAPGDARDFNSLYNCADKALYYVKHNGKNSYHFFNDKLQAEFERGGKTVDLKYLQDLMSRADNGTGAYLLDFESFNHVYNFIRRFVGRSNRDVQTVLFTVTETGNTPLEASEAEFALELLEKAIYTSLRRSDVSTRYSSKQLIVILMDADSENGDMVAERIIDNFFELYTSGKVRVDYGIARMDSRGITAGTN